jgi:hypothetical protein
MSGVVYLLLFAVIVLLVYIFRCKIPWLKDQSFTGCSSPSPIAKQLSPSPSPSTLLQSGPSPSPSTLLQSGPSPSPSTLLQSGPSPSPSTLLQSGPSPSPSTLLQSGPSPSPSPVSLNGNPGCVAGYKYCQGPNQNGINTVFYSANCPKSSSLMHDLGSPTSWKTIDCGKNPSQCIWQDVWKDTDVSPGASPTTFNLGNNVPAVLCNNDDLIIGYCPTSK